MAFGKDQSHLKKIAGYGGSVAQRAAAATRRQPRGQGGGGGQPYWVNLFKPTSTPSSIRLIPVACETERADGESTVVVTEYWKEFVTHFHGGLKKSIICSAGPHRNSKKLRQPCLGCDIFWEDYAANKGNKLHVKKISMSRRYGFAVMDLGRWHKVAQVDDNNNPKLNDKGEPYYNWEKDTGGRNCPIRAAALESKDGHMLSWDMPETQFTQLNGYSESIGSCCITCGQKDCITSVMWQCANPQCGDLVVDLDSTTLNPEQIVELTSNLYSCRACGETNFPEEVIDCSNCGPNGQSPQRASIFDVDMKIKTQDNPGAGATLILIGFSAPGPIVPELEELAKSAANLDKKFAPTPMAKQIELFGPPAAKGSHTVVKPRP